MEPRKRRIVRLEAAAVMLALCVPVVCAQEAATETIDLGKSVSGRPIVAYKLGDGPVTTAVIGAFHGDEPASAGVAQKLLDYLKKNPSELEGLTVAILPKANPDGLAAGTRQNANGVDINRNFPSGDWSPTYEKKRYYPGGKPESEPETRILMDFIKRVSPHKVLALHQPLKMLNPTGSGAELAQVMHEINGYRIDPSTGKPTPGSFGTYCGTKLGLMMLTVELDYGGTEEAWSINKEALLAALSYVPDWADWRPPGAPDKPKPVREKPRHEPTIYVDDPVPPDDKRRPDDPPGNELEPTGSPVAAAPATGSRWLVICLALAAGLLAYGGVWFLQKRR